MEILMAYLSTRKVIKCFLVSTLPAEGPFTTTEFHTIKLSKTDKK